MRPAMLLLFCLSFGPGLGPATAQAASGNSRAVQQSAPQRELAVINRGQRIVVELFASPADVDDWGDERLNGEQVLPGKQTRLRLGASRECNWDVKVTYDDRSTEENRDFNVCRLRQVSFDGSRALAAPVDPGPVRTLPIQNAAVRRIDQVYISPPDADGWDENRLEGQIASGASGSVTFRGECIADIRIVYETRAAEERRAVDLCKLSRLVVTPGWTLADDPSAEPEPPRGEQTVLVNRSGRAITQLFVFPDGGPNGEDRLGSTTLENEQRKQIELGRGQPCSFTIKAIFGTGTPDLERTGVNLCRTGQVDVLPNEVRETASQ